MRPKPEFEVREISTTRNITDSDDFISYIPKLSSIVRKEQN